MSFDLFGKTSPDEVQERNNQDHQRVFDPEVNFVLREILKELKTMNMHLSVITEEEI